ncbi:PoNe immunity protein domain-containing protein [Janthinobacterium sp. RB2P8]|uniref:PoNe immunity protein domain-containing protein n=1 Tax=Janthinobacterium sp. RB2P8 TaxID=3424191 RepID=UPI003F28F45B
MSHPSFHEKRRQQFLYEELYIKTRENQLALIEGQQENKDIAETAQDAALAYHFLYLETFWLWMLDYTAGVEIDELAPRISGIVDLFEKWNEVDQVYRQQAVLEYPEYGPYEYEGAPQFSILSDYENTLQLLSIAILLRDRRSVMRLVDMLRSHRGLDGLYEQLIGGYVDNEMALDTCILGKPYDTLLQVFYEEDEQETLHLLKQYLKQWYPAMKDHPRWHDEHLKISDEGYAGYYGYWAFEAGAAVFLLDLNDSGIDHMVYPKDLVDYARKLRTENRHTSLDAALVADGGRIEGGQPCPKAGFWETPASLHGRRYFEHGEVMPAFEDAAYGQTIWQWSAKQ